MENENDGEKFRCCRRHYFRTKSKGVESFKFLMRLNLAIIMLNECDLVFSISIELIEFMTPLITPSFNNKALIILKKNC